MDGGSSSGSLKGGGGGCADVNLKILIPSVAAGAIIGKGGETIADIQKKSGGRVKMSKANDFYPGTNERVCLITGSLESVRMILDFVMEKVRDKPDPNSRPSMDFDNKVSAEREKVVKAVIPNSTAGMIIGKGGSFIKRIKDDSGSFIQISQKSKDASLQERVVTVVGEHESNRKAMTMILDKVYEDPQSGSCLNISYSDVHGLVANFNPTGSPFATNGQSSPTGDHHHHHHHHQRPSADVSPTSSPHDNASSSSSSLLQSPFILPLQGGGALQLKFNMNPNRPPTDPSLMSQYLEHIKAALQASRYSDMAIDEVNQAISCLASHGILVINLATTQGQPTRPAHLQPPPTAPAGQTQALDGFGGYGSHFARYWSNGSNGGSDMGTTTTTAATAAHVVAFHPFSQQQQQQQQQQHHSKYQGNKNSFGLATGPPPPLPTQQQQNGHLDQLLMEPPPPPHPPQQQQQQHPPVPPQQQDQMEMEINESIVGAVIGPQGKCIVDIQQASGARIQISKKGTFSPGTRNRIVSIQGSQEAIKKAQYWIQKKVEEEEGKRERNSKQAEQMH